METVTKAEQISNIAFGFMASKALFVALHCNIFTNLSGKQRVQKGLLKKLEFLKIVFQLFVQH